MSDHYPHARRASLKTTVLVLALCLFCWLLLAGIWHTVLFIVSLF